MKTYRLLSNADVKRVIEFYRLNQNNHAHICNGYVQITREEILSFILRYIKPPLQHFKVLEDDVLTLEIELIEQGIKRPLL